MRRDSSGSALFMILMAVALFAALAFTFSRGLQQGNQSLSDRQAELAAADIMTFAARTERVVSKMLQGSRSEVTIDFAGLDGTYTNANCTTDDCKVFAAGGGGLAPLYPVPRWLDQNQSGESFYKTWFASARFCVPEIGTDTCTGTSGTDLVLMLPYIREAICKKINAKLGLPVDPLPVPSSIGVIDAGGRFNGSFSPGSQVLWDDPVLNGRSSGCVFDDGIDAYHFYQVLISR